MKTNSNPLEILIIASMLLPFIYLGIIWNQLPAEITSHYNIAGTPDDSMPKETLALLMGVLSITLYLLLRFLPRVDPRRRLQSSNYDKLRFIVSLAFTAIVGWMWYMANHQAHSQNSLSALFAIIGILLAGIGNYITTIKPNWFVGIRTPWTLDSEVVWRKTHRMGGRLMVVGGLLSALVALVVPMPYKVGAVMGIVLLASLIPVVYSYIYYRQEKASQLN